MKSQKHKISNSLRDRTLSCADESFCAAMDDLILDELPPPADGWIYCLDTAIAIKLRGYCEPHDDTFLGKGETGKNGKVKKIEHRSMFLLMSDTSKRPSHLIAEGTSTKMVPGEYAVFDDAKMHAFLADGTWVGLSVQMKRVEP